MTVVEEEGEQHEESVVFAPEENYGGVVLRVGRLVVAAARRGLSSTKRSPRFLLGRFSVPLTQVLGMLVRTTQRDIGW